MEPIRIGIAGCGMIARFHLNALARVPGACAVACYDVNPAAAQKLAEEFGLTAYTELDAFLDQAPMALVDICTPSGLRLPIIQKAAAQKKHVLLEKPLEITMARAQAAVAVCRENGVKLGCIFQSRFSPDIQRVKALIDAGRLGRITLVDGQVKWYRTAAYYADSGWRGTWAMDGGGAVMNQGIHTVDLMRYLGGEVAEVQGRAGTLAHPIQTEDTAAAVLVFENGALGTFAATTTAYPGLPAMLSVHGTEGSAMFCGEKLVFLKTQDGQDQTNWDVLSGSSAGGANPADISDEGHRHVLEDMAEAIRQNRAPAIDGEDAMATVRVVCEIYRTAGMNVPPDGMA